jgi:hypothetical protein
LHPQKFGCTPKNEGKGVHVPPDEKTCGHAVYIYIGNKLFFYTKEDQNPTAESLNFFEGSFINE